MRNKRSIIKNILTLHFLRERRLSFEFGVLTSLVIVLIVLCMGWYINAAMNALNDKAKSQSTTLNYAIAATLSNLLLEDIHSGDFSEVGNNVV